MSECDDVRFCPNCEKGSLVRQVDVPLGLLKDASKADVPPTRNALAPERRDVEIPAAGNRVPNPGLRNIEIIDCGGGIKLWGKGHVPIDGVTIINTPYAFSLGGGVSIEASNIIYRAGPGPSKKSSPKNKFKRRKSK
jgi:hypothetical protein